MRKTKIPFASLCVLCVFALIALFSACRPAPTAVPADSLPAAQPKILATVYISPTPDAPQQTATRAALRPTPTPLPVTEAPTPTVYVGVFLGESGSRDDVAAVAALQGVALPGQITPQATRDVLGHCPGAADERFGTNWKNAGSPVATLGCPAAVAIPYTGVTQVFERGAMFFTPDGAIWAVAVGAGSGGRWWHFPQAPQGEVRGEAPPAGLRAPSLGFGAVWSSVEGIRDALGWARTEESDTTFVVQDFQDGTLLVDMSAGQVFILLGTGTEGSAYGPY